MLIFRRTQPSDVDACFTVRASTRENPVSREQLAGVGITPQSFAAELKAGRIKGRICEHDSRSWGSAAGMRRPARCWC